MINKKRLNKFFLTIFQTLILAKKT